MTDEAKYSQQIKQALDAIKKLKQQLQDERNKQHEPIAVIGMAMRFPGKVNNEQEYWKLLWNNIDAIEDIPDSRFDINALYDANGGIGKTILRQGGYLEAIEQFDANFFDITRVEAESIDPQQRLLLELTQEALENSGINTQQLNNSATGVFVGITSIDYQKKHYRSGDYNLVNPYSYTGSAVCANSGRISYAYGLQGPCVSIDTACSSSLVATHLAVQALRQQQCSMAIVGAANLILAPELSICFTALTGLSPTSRCQPFSANANGFVRSEGAAIIILKRLSDAIQDNDNILALIKGSAVNQDGKSNGFTAPSVLAQTKLIKSALQDAQLTIDAVSYIEAHGTGTKIGDPIELEAISNVLSESKHKHTIEIASVKSNIGHTESVAGLAGLIKLILSIQHQSLPKNLHSDTLNPLVDWESMPLKVVQQNKAWQAETKIAGISSFGVTGTNAHVILSEYQSTFANNNSVRNDIAILPVAAKSSWSLIELLKRYSSFITTSSTSIHEIAAMAAVKRTHYNYRKAIVAIDKQEAIEQIQLAIDSYNDKQLIFDEDETIKTIFIFPGQGAQWLQMGKALLTSEPVFKESLDRFQQAISTYVTWNLFEVLYNNNNPELLEQIDIVQPCLVGIGIALSDLWKSKGIMPNAVIGHSLGEVAAAYVAEIITIEEAAKIICRRSQLMKKMSGKGLMLATDLTTTEATAIVNLQHNKVAIAVVNSTTSLVLSGDSDTIQNIASELETQERFARIIKVDVASHSYHMEEIAIELEQELTTIQPKKSTIQFYSTVEGKLLAGNELTATYWRNNLRNTVQFHKALTESMLNAVGVLLEMSPHPTLLHSSLQAIEEQQSKFIATGTLQREKNDSLSFYTNLAMLYECNYTINWNAIYPTIGTFIQLPNYAWQKECYWFDEQPNVCLDKPMIQTNNSDKQTSNLPIYITQWEKLETTQQKITQQKILAINCPSADKLFLSANNNQVLDLAITQPHFVDDASYLLIFITTESTQTYISFLQAALQYYVTKKQAPKIVAISQTYSETSAILSGIFKTLNNEYPNFNFQFIYSGNEYSQEQLEEAISLSSIYKQLKIEETALWQEQLTPYSVSSSTSELPNTEQTYLIIGGTSGLGLYCAKWLSKKGIKFIALVSRSGIKPETDYAIQEMKLNGTQVALFKGDLSEQQQLSDCLDTIATSMPEVGVIIHAAAVLQDGLFTEATAIQINSILQSKTTIARNLHHTIVAKNKRVVFFSSVASILGTMAQAIYSGANTYLDELAYQRTKMGFPTISVNWGNIAEIGLAAQNEKRGGNLKEQGIGLIYRDELDYYFDVIFSFTAPQIIPAKIDFKIWQQHSTIANNAYFASFVSTPQLDEKSNTTPIILNQTNLAAAENLIQQQLILFVSQITKIATSKIKKDETFKSIGIDSLMALQLKNKIQDFVQINLNVASVWSYPTIEKYSSFLVEELQLEQHYQPKNSITTDNNTATIENLSIEELMKQLNDKL